MTVFAKFRGFDPAARLLMINQFGINLGFYMLMPYLAGYLSGTLSLAAWAVGLVLGVRNFSQQGMFLVGGTLADRLGYKPLIVAGCLLRTAGFGMLVAVDSLPGVLIASAATGFAGALFNPAVRAYLAADAGERRVEAFAVFNVFYQAGILAGPLVGLALLALDFRVTAGAAAVVFAVLTVAQLFALPSRRAATAAEPTSVLDDWRTVVSNRRFVVFALAMVGSYVLSFQVYLALPLQADHIAGDRAQTVTSALFVISGVVAVAGQLRITAWFRSRWGTGLSLVVGMSLLAASFLPPHDRPGDAALRGRRGDHRAADGGRAAGRRHGGGVPVRDGHRGLAVRKLFGSNTLRVLQHCGRGGHPDRQSGHRRGRRRGAGGGNRLGGLARADGHRRGSGVRTASARPVHSAVRARSEGRTGTSAAWPVGTGCPRTKGYWRARA